MARGETGGWRRTATALAVAVVGTACGGQERLPPPRPIIVHTGVRIAPDRVRLDSIRGWLQRELRNIEEDPAFLVATEAKDTAPLPWNAMELVGDTARLPVPSTVPEVQIPYMVYAHLHLMVRQERAGNWLPEDSLDDEWERERAIVSRMSDAWLFQRSIVSSPPFARLDELLYAKEYGYLDAYLLAARGEEFPRVRRRWAEENPDGLREYRRWFEKTFEREPPGIRPEG